jgi:hypothetical protein
MEGLAELVNVGQITLSGLGGICLLMLALGRLMPRSTVDTLLEARDAEILRSNERADEWHKAYESERHVSDLEREHVRELIGVSKTVEHVMEALAQLAERHGDGQ